MPTTKIRTGAQSVAAIDDSDLDEGLDTLEASSQCRGHIRILRNHWAFACRCESVLNRLPLGGKRPEGRQHSDRAFDLMGYNFHE